MKIDIFNHIYPRRFFDKLMAVASDHSDMGKRSRNVSSLFDLDLRFRMMDEFGAYCQIPSIASPPIEVMAGPDTTPMLAEMANDGMAELVARYPDRFPAFTATKCDLDFFGVSRVLFASDSPFDPEGGTLYTRETIDVINRLDITDDERQQIYSRNAERLFKLTQSRASGSGF